MKTIIKASGDAGTYAAVVGAGVCALVGTLIGFATGHDILSLAEDFEVSGITLGWAVGVAFGAIQGGRQARKARNETSRSN